MLIALLTVALLSAAPNDPLFDTATELALNAACGRSPECRERRGVEARTAARTVLGSCGKHIPQRQCLTLVATLAESQMNAFPTCSPERCRDLCGVEASGLSRRCRVKCAKAISPRARFRAHRCNDRGTSRGWLQMKSVLTNACAKAMRRDIDPHDLGQATHCYAWIVARSHKANRCGVQGKNRRWGVAFARVAAGPFTRALVGGRLLRLPRCRPHGYARRAMGPRLPRAVNLEPVKTEVVP